MQKRGFETLEADLIIYIQHKDLLISFATKLGQLYQVKSKHNNRKLYF